MLTWTSITILVILAFLLRNLLHSHQLRAKARSLGCEPIFNPASGTWSVFTTVEIIVSVTKAGWNGTIHEYLRSRFAEASAQAGYRVKTMLQRSQRILTIDEANVHAIMTTQYYEFNPGTRKESFWPMLGEHSIVGVRR